MLLNSNYVVDKSSVFRLQAFGFDYDFEIYLGFVITLVKDYRLVCVLVSFKGASWCAGFNGSDKGAGLF